MRTHIHIIFGKNHQIQGGIKNTDVRRKGFISSCTTSKGGVDGDSMDEFERAVEEIYEALEGNMDREEIRKTLRKWIVGYKLSLDEAKRGIIVNYGGSNKLLDGKFKKLNELRAGEGRLNLRVKVLSINEKVHGEGETRKKYYYGMVGDDTAVLPFTAWNLNVNIRKGDCIEIKNAYTKEWRGQIQVTIGQNTRVEILPPDSVKVRSEIRKAKVKDLHPRMGLVEVAGKILNVEKRTIVVDGNERDIYTGIFADDTGEIPFTSWDTPVEKGSTLRISGAYVSTFRGMPQLVFDSRSTIREENMEIKIKETPVPIESLEGKGGFNVLLEGVIIDVKDGSGLIYRCPECGRVISGSGCPVHGRVKPVADLRIKAILDDGTGAVMCLFNREQTEKILGKSLEEVIDMVKDNLGNPSVILDMVEDKLIARPMKVRGNVMNDEKYGLRMLIKDFEMINMDDIAKKAEKMLDEMGW